MGGWCVRSAAVCIALLCIAGSNSTGAKLTAPQNTPRWLAARGWDPERAAHDLAAHASWRAAFAPAGRIQKCEVEGQLAQDKVMVQGLDRQGRGVVILVGGNHIPG